jgi:hypothetical protein
VHGHPVKDVVEGVGVPAAGIPGMLSMRGLSSLNGMCPLSAIQDQILVASRPGDS